jgi:hypothetical protein
MNIFVGGSLKNVPLYGDLCERFVRQLGVRIVAREHTLLTGCRGSLDKAVAEAASGWLDENGRDKRQWLISYRLKNDEPAHRLGRIQVSRRVDWDLSHPDLSPPEQIAESDAAVFVAGGPGTFCAANWARIANKPILGVGGFGGAGRDIFEREQTRFNDRYAHYVTPTDFAILNQDTVDTDQFAADVVTLCERVIITDTVFTIMPFVDDFREAFESFFIVCGEFGFRAERTDESTSNERIIPRILEGIRRSAFVIADVTCASPNVSYEVGFAQGVGRPVIITARKGTVLPFDFADIPTVFWTGQDDLRQQLRKRIKDVDRQVRKRPCPE